MFQKVSLLFLSICYMATVAAGEDGAYPLSITTDDRDALDGLDSITEECVDGTIALASNEAVQDALLPFIVDIFNFNEDPACEISFFPSELTCNFDFTALVDEHETAKSVCKASGGKIFLFNLDTLIKIPFLELSVDVEEFPLCVDPSCNIDSFLEAVGIKSKAQFNPFPNEMPGAMKKFELTTSCVEDKKSKFILKKKRKNKIKRNCVWLEKINVDKMKRICGKPKSNKKNVREACHRICCMIPLA